MTDKVIPRTVSMYSSDWDVVDEIDARYGFRSTSAALRYIVNRFSHSASQAAETADQKEEPRDDG